MRAWAAIGCAAVLSLAGCKRDEEPAADNDAESPPQTAAKADEAGAQAETATDRERGPASPTAAPDPRLVTALQALGEDYPMVGAFHPAQWQGFHERLAPLVGLVPELGAAWSRIAAPDHVVLALMEDVLSIADVDEEAALTGLDPTRPILFGIMRPSLPDLPTGELTPLVWGGASELTMRHELRLPASDPAALVASLDRALAQVGEARPDQLATHPGAKLHARAGQFAAIIPEADHVRVVAGIGGAYASAETLAGELDAPTPSTELTPALLGAASPTAVGSLVVRPWRLRALGTWLGSMEATRAIATVSPDYRGMMLERVVALLLQSEAVMSDAPVELDDWAFTLTSSDGALGLHALASVAPTGRAVLDANPVQTHAFGLKEGKAPLAESLLALDTKAALDLTTEPAFAPTLERADDTFETLRECGATCANHLALRAPFGMAKLLLRLAGTEGSRVPDVTLAHLVLVDFTDGAPVFALALELAAGSDASGVHAWAEQYRKVSVSDGVRDGKPVLMLGLEVDPATVFDLEHPGRAVTDLGTTSVELGKLASAVLSDMGSRAAEVRPLVDALGGAAHADAWLRHEGSALVYDVVLSTAGPAEAPPIPDLTKATWTSPHRVASSDDAAACLARATLTAGKTIVSLSTTAIDIRPGVVVAGLSALGAVATSCSSDAPTTKTIEHLEAYVRELGRWEIGGQGAAATLPVLKAECTRTGDASICSDAKTAAAMKSVPPLEVDIRCDPAGRGASAGVPVQISSDGILVGLTEVEPDAAKIGAALVDHAPLSMGGKPIVGATLLHVAADTPYAEVVPVLRAAVEHADGSVGIWTDNGHGGQVIGLDVRSKAERATPPLTSPVTVAIDPKRLDIGGTSLPVKASPADVVTRLGESADPPDIVIEPATDAPWSAVVTVAAAACTTRPAVLVLP